MLFEQSVQGGSFVVVTSHELCCCLRGVGPWMLPQIGRFGETSAFGCSLSNEHEGAVEDEYIVLMHDDIRSDRLIFGCCSFTLF
jgi:hypothetical protein